MVIEKVKLKNKNRLLFVYFEIINSPNSISMIVTELKFFAQRLFCEMNKLEYFIIKYFFISDVENCTLALSYNKCSYIVFDLFFMSQFHLFNIKTFQPRRLDSNPGDYFSPYPFHHVPHVPTLDIPKTSPTKHIWLHSKPLIPQVLN